jgi:sugar/nucleoside kinase (ribokinase family)
VVEQDPHGVSASDVDSGQFVEAPPMPVEVVTGPGAGDAFGGARCHGLPAGREPRRTVRSGNAAGAFVASQLLVRRHDARRRRGRPRRTPPGAPATTHHNGQPTERNER